MFRKSAFNIIGLAARHSRKTLQTPLSSPRISLSCTTRLRSSTGSSLGLSVRRYASTPTNADSYARVSALLNEGSTALSEGKTHLALDRYIESIRIQPTSEAYYNVGNVYYQMGRPNDALRNWEASIEINPQADAYINCGNVYFLHLNDTSRAITCYEKALELAPNDGQVHFNLGCILDKEGKLERAVEEFEAADQLGIEKADVFCKNVKAKLMSKKIKNDL